MRHAFDVGQNVSFRTHTGGKIAGKSLPRLASMTLAGSRSTASSTRERITPEQAADQSGGTNRPLMLGAILPEARFFGCEDLALAEVAGEIQDCAPGDLVLYRIGESDPNKLIAEALARGAGGILTEQILPCPLPQCVVGSVDLALAKIASTKHRSPDRKLLTVGVLGQSGKTSTCLLAATLTKALGIRTAYQCDLGSSDGVLSDTPDRAVAVGADLIEWLGESSDCMSRVAIMEIDETAARHGNYDGLQFDVLMVTGKRELADDFGPCGLQCLLERLTPSGIVIVPDDDSRTVRMLDESTCHYITYGTSADSDFGAIVVDQSGGMSTLMLSAGDRSVMMESPLCGIGMASNIAAVSALGGLLGQTLQDIAKHLAELRTIPGRGQRLVDFGKATVVIETGGAVDRVTHALRTAKATGAGGRVWCVMSVGEGDCEETLARYGRTIERFAHQCVVTSKPDESGSFLRRAHQVLDGVKKCAAIRLVADQGKALQWAIESSRPRDTIVVITNRRDQTAVAARTELDAIQAVVKSCRARIDAESISESADDDGSPITLKLFP
jgi:UDP-N-acetylmuramoyl-L-alanyl-D-glutamate--2,6-diaminopimelate ligase